MHVSEAATTSLTVTFQIENALFKIVESLKGAWRHYYTINYYYFVVVFSCNHVVWLSFQANFCVYILEMPNKSQMKDLIDGRFRGIGHKILKSVKDILQ